MIGGTITGVLIAIMLGRMKMSVQECIDASIMLADRVFRQTHTSPLSFIEKVRGRFDSDALTKAVKKHLVKHSLPEDCLLQDVDQAPCKILCLHY